LPTDSSLHLAVLSDDEPEQTAFRALVAEHKAAKSLDQAGASGHTALALAAHKKRSALAQILLDAGANARSVGVRPDESKLTPLHFAAKNGDAELVRSLLAHGANASAEASIMNTPLHMACGWAAGADTVKALLAAGASASAQDLELFTCLHLSVYAHAIDAERAAAQIRELIDNHCAHECANLTTKAGLTALDIATQHQLPEAVLKVLRREHEPDGELKNEL
jgi:ankyrin repeat protein